jgi:cytochrome c oxidase subunit 2
MLGYGPHQAASAHGPELDSMFNVTLFFTGIVFVLTHIALFYFAYKYRGRKGALSTFIPHDNKLEIIWTAVPAVVMCFLVIRGLVAWNDVMADVKEDEEHIEIEATGSQFLWYLRYPGPDGKLGARNYKLITGKNPLGQDWLDDKNLDDVQPADLVLPVNKKVRVRITARDVLHNFYLPHFRVKMDAVPGMPTYFVFTPTKTTEEYRQELSKYPEYQQPTDPKDPDSEPLWKTFNYELACAELCGKGHFSMKKLVKIVSEDEYNAWLKEQQSYYMANIRNSEEDPRRNQLLDIEIKQREQDFNLAVEKALSAAKPEEKIIRLNHVYFETGSAKLTELSRYELGNLVKTLNKYPKMTIEVAGHTDNTGDPASNLTLSQDRSKAVFDYLVKEGVTAARLVSRGYGQNKPVDTNDTDEGRAKNRRTEFQIITQ